MIAKEKAKELVKNHTIFQGDDGTLCEYWTDNLEAIRHASLTVNEIIKSLENINEIDETIYWINVKQELQELCAEL